MTPSEITGSHDHFFLAPGHAHAERRTWIVIALCLAMMALEIAGGTIFGSIALVADGLHMSTHAGALMLAALAYSYARRHATDPRFSFGTGKLGDLAGFTSAIVLAMIALLIGYEAAGRLVSPVPIDFNEALPIAALGLAVNVASAWLLAGSHDHGHSHDLGHGNHPRDDHDDNDHGHDHDHDHNDHASTHRDNNMRAAVVHVIADAAVSVLVILALLLARAFGWTWTDPAAGLVGAVVIASWAYGLVRDTGAILLDMNPDRALAERIRATIEDSGVSGGEGGGDRLTDLHLWRLGPGHLGAILCICSEAPRTPDFYKARLAGFKSLSHVTVETIELRTAR